MNFSFKIHEALRLHHIGASVGRKSSFCPTDLSTITSTAGAASQEKCRIPGGPPDTKKRWQGIDASALMG
jgi:hypothetical protein